MKIEKLADAYLKSSIDDFTTFMETMTGSDFPPSVLPETPVGDEEAMKKIRKVEIGK